MANPHGKRSYINSIAGVQASIILPSNWLLLLNTQYERFGGQLNGDSVISPVLNYKTSGTFKRYYNCISINPQIGRIILKKAVTLALHTGIDYAFNLTYGDDFDFRDENGERYIMGGSGGTPETNDFRFTFGISLARSIWGLDLNYKHGVTKYKNYGTGNAYSSLFHIRLLGTFLNKEI